MSAFTRTGAFHGGQHTCSRRLLYASLGASCHVTTRQVPKKSDFVTQHVRAHNGGTRESIVGCAVSGCDAACPRLRSP